MHSCLPSFPKKPVFPGVGGQAPLSVCSIVSVQYLSAGGPAFLECELNFPFLLTHMVPLHNAFAFTLEVITASPATPVIQNSSSPHQLSATPYGPA